MSEESLPPFARPALRFIPGTLKRSLVGLFKRRRRSDDAAGDDPALRSRTASAIREFAEAHATLFERAERLEEKAERLEKAGTPSESARNRAERAKSEVVAGLAALRASFANSEARRAFDREVASRYPAFQPSGENS